MADPKFHALIHKLLERSREHKVEWEATAAAGVFQAAFPHYSVKVYTEPGTHGEDYILQIADEQGQVIDEVRDTDFSDELDNMRELFNYARSSGLGLDRALDSIIAALGSDEPPPPTETTDSPEPPEITDEDVPF
jgi:hypothetical protein